MAKKFPDKRKRSFVKKGYQFKFIVKFCLIVLAGTFISMGLLFIFSQGTLTSSFQDSRLVIKNTALAIMPSVIYVNIVTFALILMATIVVVLFISHKIAGPMFRFEKELMEIGQGDLTKAIRLRQKDQIMDMAVSINDMTASLHHKVRTIQDDLKQIIDSASNEKAPQSLIIELKNLDKKIDESFTI